MNTFKHNLLITIFALLFSAMAWGTFLLPDSLVYITNCEPVYHSAWSISAYISISIMIVFYSFGNYYVCKKIANYFVGKQVEN